VKDENGNEITFEVWDPAEEILNKEDVFAYLEAALEENDAGFLARTIGYILHSKGLQEILEENKHDKNETPFLAVVNTIDKLGYRLIFSEKEKITA